jgi:hypothetical protein
MALRQSLLKDRRASAPIATQESAVLTGKWSSYLLWFNPSHHSLLYGGWAVSTFIILWCSQDGLRTLQILYAIWFWVVVKLNHFILGIILPYIRLWMLMQITPW